VRWRSGRLERNPTYFGSICVSQDSSRPDHGNRKRDAAAERGRGAFIGVENGVVGTSGLGFTSLIVCFSNLPEKVATAVDAQMDDARSATGQIRAQLQATANPFTDPTPATNYVETGVNQYLLCKNY